MISHIEKECFGCELHFTVVVDDLYEEVSYCPFCGEGLEDEYTEEDDD